MALVLAARRVHQSPSFTRPRGSNAAAHKSSHHPHHPAHLTSPARAAHN